MLDFHAMLELAKFDPAEVLAVRHAPVEKSLRQILPSLVVERPDLFLAHQRIQWPALEKAMTRAKYVASFLGQEPTRATFAGIFRIGEWETLDYEGFQKFPGNSELEQRGMSLRDADMPDCLAFALEPLDHYAEWVGRLVIAWPKPHQQWWRWPRNSQFPIVAIETESRFVQAMPDWRELVLPWRELQNLPRSWQATLAQWRGVYLIYDTALGAAYVGSAYGEDNILGRWRAYAETGHGGNRKLRACDPDNLRFSILERTSPDLDAGAIIALEGTWKDRLHTREFGLNLN